MKRLFWIGFLLAVSSGICLAQSDGPSLADLARQNHDGKKPVKVFTNDDFVKPAARGETTSAGAGLALTTSGSGTTGDNSPAAGNKAASKTKDSAPGSPAANAPKPDALKKELEVYTKERDGWKSSAQRYQDLLEDESSDFRRQMYQTALENDQHNVDLYQAKIDQIQQELSKSRASAGAVDGANHDTAEPAEGDSGTGNQR
ncbi:MAG TPA: hypothetical protein VLT16_07800 [Candidatus Limnocylindrales bacterium]|nr:hypothetical protein [Candidatus Limnocylindrales bacterium]